MDVCPDGWLHPWLSFRVSLATVAACSKCLWLDEVSGTCKYQLLSSMCDSLSACCIITIYHFFLISWVKLCHISCSKILIIRIFTWFSTRFSVVVIYSASRHDQYLGPKCFCGKFCQILWTSLSNSATLCVKIIQIWWLTMVSSSWVNLSVCCSVSYSLSNWNKIRIKMWNQWYVKTETKGYVSEMKTVQLNSY